MSEDIVLKEYPDTTVRRTLAPLPTRGGNTNASLPDTVSLPNQSELQRLEREAIAHRKKEGYAL